MLAHLARRAVLLLPLLLAARPARAQDDIALLARIQAWFDEAERLAPGQWGVAIADQKGTLLWSHNATEPMVPASTVKLLTTGYARTVLGPDARIATRVTGEGRLLPSTGEWVGSWALQLNGDVTLERMPGTGPSLEDLARQLHQAGVRRLRGPLTLTSERGTPDAVYPDVWSGRHRGRSFAPLVGPLMVHENIVVIRVGPGTKVGGRAVLLGASPHGIDGLVSVRATTRKGRRTRLSLQPRADGGWVVAGTIGRSSRARTLVATSRNPRKVLELAWARALEDAGIEWTPAQPVAKAPAGSMPAVLAEVYSPVFDTVASEVNRRSLNSGAELLLQWAGGRDSAAQRLTAHVAAVTGLAGGAHLVDGSGLSYENRVTPHTFIAYLSRFPATPAGRGFPYLLPANGAGTLRQLRTGFPGTGVVRAKTGTLAEAANVVGYLGRPGGVLLVALLYNGRRPSAARQAEWRLFRLLGADGVVVPSDTTPLDPGALGGENSDAEPTREPDE